MANSKLSDHGLSIVTQDSQLPNINSRLSQANDWMYKTNYKAENTTYTIFNMTPSKLIK